ncbi:uncharacterized protein PV09_02749 [Verruconis gallopava]|uniref:SnoaL-like domain-containing protein n=1 Tax=Verruconis gallopava TaxID=253628 RepID=A0A0D2AH78_9PEZI|nr:uncharacterized protein PV09_02749 [Verruconis gallopava]KIW06278.1 hypothetical protein PV09_02749 [Verruconis gallopava]
MAASRYASEYPANLPFEERYRKFIEEFYQVSDTPSAHDQYVARFAPNARLVMASKVAVGAEEILALRRALWEKVNTRSHRPLKVFPFGANSDEVMIYGTVEYGFKDGRNGGLEWAAKGKLGVDETGKVVWRDYQVYMDTAAQNK